MKDLVMKDLDIKDLEGFRNNKHKDSIKKLSIPHDLTKEETTMDFWLKNMDPFTSLSLSLSLSLVLK